VQGHAATLTCFNYEVAIKHCKWYKQFCYFRHSAGGDEEGEWKRNWELKITMV